MRVVSCFAVVFALAACNTSLTNNNNQEKEPVGGSPAPETRPPEKPLTAKQSDVVNNLRKEPHLSVQMLNDNTTILVQMRSGDSFQSDSASPTKILMDVLDYVVSVLNSSSDKYEMLVVGHTDNVGSQQANMQMSEKRALTVTNYLTSRGFDWRHLKYVGKGAREPIADNNSQEGRDVNRRVDLLISPVHSKPVPNPECLFPNCL